MDHLPDAPVILGFEVLDAVTRSTKEIGRTIEHLSGCSSSSLGGHLSRTGPGWEHVSRNSICGTLVRACQVLFKDIVVFLLILFKT